MPKTPSLGVRVQPETKDALDRAAKDDLRSVSSLIEKILVEWLRGKGYMADASLKPRAIAVDDMNASNDE